MAYIREIENNVGNAYECYVYISKNVRKTFWLKTDTKEDAELVIADLEMAMRRERQRILCTKINLEDADIQHLLNLMKKLNRLLPDTKIIYVSKAELHSAKRGWHAHVMIRFENNSKPLSRKEIDKYMDFWKYGYVYISEIYDAEGLAHYLLDIVKSTKAYKNSVANGNSYDNKYKKYKKYKNYEQSLYYPKGCKLYTTSIGLKKPPIDNVKKEAYDKMVADKQLILAESKIITNSDREILSKFTKIIHS